MSDLASEVRAGRWSWSWAAALAGSIVLGLACGAPSSEVGAAEPLSRIAITDARARLMPDMGSVYLTVENRTSQADRLLAVTTAAARAAELHETRNENSVMRMVSHAEGVDIPPRAAVRFEPGGLHIMLVGPHSQAADSTVIALVLHFEIAGAVEVEAAVLDRGAAAR